MPPGPHRLLAGEHDLEALFIEGTRLDRPVLVLLHEALGSVMHWKDFPLELSAATGAPVFAYSRPGHGHSSPLTTARSTTYLHEEAELLGAVLDRAGIQRPILFGHSDGASIALLYASANADRVAGLVLEAPHVFVEPAATAGVARSKSAYASTNLQQKLARYHRDADALFTAWHTIWLDPAFGSWNIESELGTIRCPVLLIQGVADAYGTLEQIDRIVTRVPHAEAAILDDCGHAPHRDQSARTIALVSAFVDRPSERN